MDEHGDRMINTMVESFCWSLTRGLNRPAQFLGPCCVGRGVPSIFAGNSCRDRCTVRPKLVACCHFHHALIDVNCDDITIDRWQAVNRLDGYDGTLLRDQRRLHGPLDQADRARAQHLRGALGRGFDDRYQCRAGVPLHYSPPAQPPDSWSDFSKSISPARTPRPSASWAPDDWR